MFIISAIVNVSTNFFNIILEKACYAVFEIFLTVSNEKIIFKSDSLSLSNLTITQDGTKYTIAGMTIYREF
ncbi:hypothetical protein [Candidatus Clostridium radicumherbarum]|uniref:Uncharacterized protein n=1 Tax=Candidatus Clostridium radicumherbarum TaxID=3381662 RepID=A0ABW8TTN3_9CLOT